MARNMKKIEKAVRLPRLSKAARFPPWTGALLAQYHKSPLVEVYLGRYKVYWRPRGSREEGQVVVNPHIVDDYCANIRTF
jgi:hypothetical protein